MPTTLNLSRGLLWALALLLEVIGANRERPVGELLEAIVSDAVRFSGRVQEDDLTLVVARCR